MPQDPYPKVAGLIPGIKPLFQKNLFNKPLLNNPLYNGIDFP